MTIRAFFVTNLLLLAILFYHHPQITNSMWTQQQDAGNDLQEDSMNTLTYCVNKVVKDGYTDNFKVTPAGLLSAATDNYYQPEQIQVKDFYRFEGNSDPADNSIMYVIETTDGAKGTLIDAYGPYSDGRVQTFMDQVADMHKKVTKGEQQ